MNSHAGTHCFGRNFCPISSTGQECSVAPFLPEYSEQENVPICTGAAAYTMDTGEVVIMILGQGLWFGHRMEKSLINSYQCRAFGISLCDDPVDPHRPLGIQVDDTTFIPMEMVGSTYGFNMRYPMDEDLENCPHLEISDQFTWDPSKDIFNVSSMEVERNNNGLSFRNIFSVRGYVPGAPPVRQI